MPSSLNGTGLTFSSGQTLNALPVTSFIGQTGAVDPTTYGGVGSVLWAYLFSTSNVNANTTIAGTSLVAPSSVASTTGGSLYYYYANSSNYTSTVGNSVSTLGHGIRYQRQNAGNLGFAVPLGTSQLSGTWRILAPTGAGSYSYDAAYAFYTAAWPAVLVVRIS